MEQLRNAKPIKNGPSYTHIPIRYSYCRIGVVYMLIVCWRGLQMRIHKYVALGCCVEVYERAFVKRLCIYFSFYCQICLAMVWNLQTRIRNWVCLYAIYTYTNAFYRVLLAMFQQSLHCVLQLLVCD